MSFRCKLALVSPGISTKTPLLSTSASQKKPFTKCGVLSATSSIFDPLGFLIPITISGRMLVREITDSGVEWDQPLPEDMKLRWETWKGSLETVRDQCFPRMFMQDSWSEADSLKIHIFADASEKAIPAVAYIRAVFGSDVQVGFLMGKSKLSPHGGTTMPRIELCAAVLANELADTIMEHLDVSSDEFIYHSDSKVVLGYLNNRARRFYTYVANRVQAVLKSSKASQWQYVPTQNNPADCGTRCNTLAQEFPHSMWIAGPAFLKAEGPSKELGDNSQFNLINETEDRELRPEIHVKATMLRRTIASRFEKFSTWKTLVRAFSLLRRVGRAGKAKMPITASNVVDDEDKKNYLIQMAQEDAFGKEIIMLKKNEAISNKSCIIALSPVFDNQNILRVGGRISKAPITNDQQHPVIIPRKSQVAHLLVNHFHTKVQHQGRLVTESAIRTSGLLIIGAKRLVSSVIQKCVTCRKLRGNFLIQRMADLPADRVTPAPPSQPLE